MSRAGRDAEVRFGAEGAQRRGVSTAGVDHSGRWLAAIALACLAAVGAALVSQHLYGMEPCPWCVLQRLIFVAIAAVCAIGLAWRSAIGRALAGTLVLLLGLGGIASALWQHFYAAPSGSCNLTLADKIINGLRLDALIPDVFAPRATCADAAVSLFGVPYDFWSLALFVAIAAAALVVLTGRRNR
ncbi:MAG: disulfide bond formation protein B [Caldimonas sp.]